MGSGDVQKLAKWLEKWIVWELQKQDPVAGYSRVATSRARAALHPRPPGPRLPLLCHELGPSPPDCSSGRPTRRCVRHLPLRSAARPLDRFPAASVDHTRRLPGRPLGRFPAASVYSPGARRCLGGPPAGRRGSRRFPAVLAESCDTDAALLLLSVLDSACSASPRPSQHGDDDSRPPPRTASA